MSDSDLLKIASGQVDPRVPAEVLVQCEKGHWRSVITHNTLFTHPRHYKMLAAACPHFSTK